MAEEIMYDTSLTLREVFAAYCDHNGISILQVCKTTGIPWTTLSSWVRGERGLRVKNANKIRDFLKGKYIVDENVIAEWLKNRKHLTN